MVKSVRLMLHKFRYLIMFGLSWLSFPVAFAHPHDFILLTVEPVLNERHEIVALKEQWLFSPFTAQMVLEPVLEIAGYDAQKTEFQRVNDEMRERLHKQHFFTFEADQFVDEAQQFELMVNADGDLILQLILALKQPGYHLRYQIYEPTYWVSMVHDDNHLRQWDNGCSLTLLEPSPSEEDYMMASMLDIEARGPTNLGKVFAQTGEIDCSDE